MLDLHYYGLLLPHNLINQWRINIQNYMLYHPVFPQHYNELIWMSRMWNKYQTLYVRFPLVNHWILLEIFTRDIAENYVSTFVIFQMFWFLTQRSKIYQKLYVIFSTILGCKLQIFLFINEGQISDILCQLILYFHNVTIHWHKGVVSGINIIHSMLDLH